MSGEQLTVKESINTSEVQLSKNSNTASRVNINDLLLKVKQEQEKEKKENIYSDIDDMLSNSLKTDEE